MAEIRSRRESADACGVLHLTLPQLLRQRARETPDATALRQKVLGLWQVITWQQYYKAARSVALGLHALGLRRGDRIAIASEGTPEWFYSDLGAEMLGIEVVGIYPTNPATELRYIVEHCAARAVICGDQEQTDKVLDALTQAGDLPRLEHIVAVDTKGMRRYQHPRLRSFEALLEAGHHHLQTHPDADAWLDAEIDATRVDDVNVVIYTSGTAGAPKGAMLTHANLTHAADALVAATGLRTGEYEAVCYLPLCHVAERCYSMVLHLMLRGIVNFAESTDTVAANIREIAPTFFLGVPRIWEKLQQGMLVKAREPGNPWRRLFNLALQRGTALVNRRIANGGRRSLADRVEYAFWTLLMFRNMQRAMGLDRTRIRICGGASVSPETLRFFEAIGLQILQGYGLTEASGVSFLQRPGPGTRPGVCGLPLAGVEWAFGADNEILIKAPTVFRGYVNDPAGTAAVLDADGWLHTGDIGALDDAGELLIVDRKKAIIVTSGGKNIAPSEIENALKDSPYIREAIVVGDGRKYLGGLIQIDFESVANWAGERDLSYTSYKSLATHPEVYRLVNDIVAAVNQRFARVENVRAFVILEKELDHEDGELTATQKIRRSVIEQRFAQELARIYPPEHHSHVA